MKVPLLDLKKQYEKIKDEVLSAAEEVFDSQQFIFGPKLKELEERIAEYSDCKYAIGVSSGTDALLISLMTAGIEKNDFVITTPYMPLGYLPTSQNKCNHWWVERIHTPSQPHMEPTEGLEPTTSGLQNRCSAV